MRRVARNLYRRFWADLWMRRARKWATLADDAQIKTGGLIGELMADTAMREARRCKARADAHRRVMTPATRRVHHG